MCIYDAGALNYYLVSKKGMGLGGCICTGGMGGGGVEDAQV